MENKFLGGTMYALMLMMGIYKEFVYENPYEDLFFKEIYSNTKDPRNSQLLSFFQKTHTPFPFPNIAAEQKHSLRVFNVLTQDLLRRTKQTEYWESDDEILLNTAINIFKHLRSMSKAALIVPFNTNKFNNFIGAMAFSCAKSPKIREAFLHENVLLCLMDNSCHLSVSRPNEAVYLESFLRLLEILIFDQELMNSNFGRVILEEFFKEHELIKNLKKEKFCSDMNIFFQFNKPVFSEVFAAICEVKINKNKELLVKLKDGKLQILKFFF